MNDFNENPFKKDTPVIPFSNATEYMIWKDENCVNCKKYECESENEEEAKCKLAYHVDLGTITGNIPLWVAKRIGCKYDPLYGFVELSDCREFEDAENELPF